MILPFSPPLTYSLPHNTLFSAPFFIPLSVAPFSRSLTIAHPLLCYCSLPFPPSDETPCDRRQQDDPATRRRQGPEGRSTLTHPYSTHIHTPSLLSLPSLTYTSLVHIFLPHSFLLVQVEKCTFEQYEVYAIDICMTTGEGKHLSHTHPCHTLDTSLSLHQHYFTVDNR